jgi:parallel beta-helix repeat protein
VGGSALKRKISSLIVCFFIILALFIGVDMHFDVVPTTKGATIYVGGSNPGNFSTIQEGIDAANPGDTVYVYNGTYNEADLIIDKTISLVGEGRNNTTITNNVHPLLATVCVWADWVNITGFNITDGVEGIRIDHSNQTNISNNILYNNGMGIDFWSSHNNTIINNFIFSNANSGIIIEYESTNNFIIDNNVSGSIHGIDIDADENIISNNSVYDNGIGIQLYLAEGNDVFNNNVYSNNIGIDVCHFSFGNNVFDNTITNNPTGIQLFEDPNDNQIFDNIISHGNHGIYHYLEGENNVIRNNTILNNNYGFYIEPVSPSSIYYIYHNNIINNTIQAYDEYSGFKWNDTYPSGGNFWSDYNGSDFFKGPNQDIPGSDGIGDTPYFFNFSQDNYPLMEPMGNFTFLHNGWNPISISRIQSSNALEDVLSQINGLYDAVSWYNESDSNDPWKISYTSKPSHLNDLDSLDHTMGFWIHITEPGGVIYNYNGTVPTQNQTIDLHAGWNFVGYPSLSNKYRDEALNNLSFGTHLDAIWTYNSGANKWEEVGELNYFVVGKGYWIHAKEKCVWEVPL